MDNDGGFHGDVEQEAISHHLNLFSQQWFFAPDGEEVGMGAFHCKATGIVVEVMYPSFELPFSHEDFVVVARFE